MSTAQQLSDLAQNLLTDLMHTTPFQPATNWWRCIELAEVLRFGLPAGRGLDLGCGDGELTRIILKHSANREQMQLVGVDIDPQETQAADQTGLYQRVHTCSATAIPEESASFDFVFSNSVLEHIGPIDATLAEMSRLLKPGGRFILTVPGPEFHFCLKTPKDRGERSRLLAEIDQRCAHLRYWHEQEWRAALNRCDCDIERCAEYLRAPAVQHWQQLADWTSGLLLKLSREQDTPPIELQRRYGLRGKKRLPETIARPIARLISSSKALASEADESLPAGCLIVIGRKNPIARPQQAPTRH